MRVKAVFGGILLVIFSTIFISAPTASAGECSVEDPCQTYAVMNGNQVANIIVCQPSVCGSGMFNNQRVVPQVAADSTGQNRGGYWGTESNGIFTVEKSGPVNKITETINNVEVTVTMNGTLKDQSTFSDTVDKPVNEWFKPAELPLDTQVIISADDETLSFDNRITIEDFDFALWFSGFQMLIFNLNFFEFNLFSWGWFL